MIYKIEDYFNDEGVHVKEFVVVDGERPKDFPKFVGVGLVEINFNGHVVPRQFTATLDVDNLQDAFKIAKDELNSAVPEIEKRFREEIHSTANKIIVPN